MQHPSAKVMVLGNTEMPNSFHLWTRVLQTSNIMFFYGVAKHQLFLPSWGVIANLMVKGLQHHNHTVQFKSLYPKTGGGENIDFIHQMKLHTLFLLKRGLGMTCEKIMHLNFIHVCFVVCCVLHLHNKMHMMIPNKIHPQHPPALININTNKNKNQQLVYYYYNQDNESVWPLLSISVFLIRTAKVHPWNLLFMWFIHHPNNLIRWTRVIIQWCSQ